MPGLAPRMDVLFWGGGDFSNKILEQGYVKERLKSSLRKFYGRYGDFIKQYKVSLSQMLNDILWPDHIQWQPLTDQTLYRTRPFTEFWEVSIEHLRRVWHADRGRLLLRTPGPVLLGLAYAVLVEYNHFSELVVIFSGLCSSNIPRHFLDLALGSNHYGLVPTIALSVKSESFFFFIFQVRRYVSKRSYIQVTQVKCLHIYMPVYTCSCIWWSIVKQLKKTKGRVRRRNLFHGTSCRKVLVTKTRTVTRLDFVYIPEHNTHSWHACSDISYR